jgi:primosomal protein N' (replication factor Y) (superfamily II helicase)
VGGRVVRVLPEEAAINKVFDYLVPHDFPGADLVRVGTEVRIELHGRRTGGWIIAADVPSPPGIELRSIAKVRGYGPPAEIVELAMWTAWRWGGRASQVLRFCNPPLAIRHLPSPGTINTSSSESSDSLSRQLRKALTKVDSECRDNQAKVIVIRTPPAIDRTPVILETIAYGGASGALIITPSIGLAENLTRRLRRLGLPVALLPQDWAAAAAGSRVVIGARAAVFAPIQHPGIVMVLDEHDEALQDERTPTWHARDVAIERARRLNVPCVLTSAHPTPEALVDSTVVIALDRLAERAAWPIIDIIDRSKEEPGRHRLLSPRLTNTLRNDERVLCILNRTGRAKLIACASCSEVARCERCDAAVQQPDESAELVCARCDFRRPVVCPKCGGGRMKNLRVGTARAREELEALALRPAGEITANQTDEEIHAAMSCGVIVGTEALLHRVDRASTVIFLDADADLLAPRFRAAEQSMAMFSRAARLLNARTEAPSRLIIQTRQPSHPALAAIALADPARLAEYDLDLRTNIGNGPTLGTASISGFAAPAWIERLSEDPTVQIGGTAATGFLVRAATHDALSEALARVDTNRPPGRVRIEVDPLRI